MTKSIYDQHAAAFSQTSAYAILKDGKHIANVNFKFPRDGAGRLYCYVHVIGLPMVRDFAGGYGYDKRSAAFTRAIYQQCRVELESWQDDSEGDYTHLKSEAAKMRDAVNKNQGQDWNHALAEAGFTVINVM